MQWLTDFISNVCKQAMANGNMLGEIKLPCICMCLSSTHMWTQKIKMENSEN